MKKALSFLSALAITASATLVATDNASAAKPKSRCGVWVKAKPLPVYGRVCLALNPGASLPIKTTYQYKNVGARNANAYLGTTADLKYGGKVQHNRHASRFSIKHDGKVRQTTLAYRYSSRFPSTSVVRAQFTLSIAVPKGKGRVDHGLVTSWVELRA